MRVSEVTRIEATRQATTPDASIVETSSTAERPGSRHRSNSTPIRGRTWLSLFSLIYGLQSIAMTVSAIVHATLHGRGTEPLIDLRIFYAAARLAAQGGNPYNITALMTMEHTLFPTYDALAGRSAAELPYMHGPLPLLALRLFPQWDTPLMIVALLSLVALLIVSCLLLMAAWPGQGRLAFLTLMIGLPPVIEEIGLGQLSSVVLVGICGGLFLARRGNVATAVALAVVTASVKPHLGVLAFCAVGSTIDWRIDRRVWLGLLGGIVVIVAATVVTTGWTGVGEWLSAPLHFDQQGLTAQLDLMTLPGVVSIVLPAQLAHLAMILIMSAWAAGMIWLWRRWRRGQRLRDTGAREAWLALVCAYWLVCAPYGHTPDLILVLPSLWFLWRRAEQSRGALFLLLLGYGTLWSTAWVRTTFPLGTAMGRWIGLPCALAFCPVIVLSIWQGRGRERC